MHPGTVRRNSTLFFTTQTALQSKMVSPDLGQRLLLVLVIGAAWSFDAVVSMFKRRLCFCASVGPHQNREHRRCLPQILSAIMNTVFASLVLTPAPRTLASEGTDCPGQTTTFGSPLRPSVRTQPATTPSFLHLPRSAACGSWCRPFIFFPGSRLSQPQLPFPPQDH